MNTCDRLLQSARKEFLANGFEKASLRTICRKAGLTTGALYSRFSNKEDLFTALVDPVIDSFQAMYSLVISSELEDINAAALENEITSVLFAIAHKDEFRLLFECSAGTSYEGYKDRLINEVFYPSYQAVFDRYAGRPVDPRLVRIILRMKFEEYMDLIYGGYSKRDVIKLITQLTAFSQAGFHCLLEEPKDPV